MKQDNQHSSDILLDILWAAQRIEEYTAGIDRAAFYQDVKLQDKVIRRLLSISKNAKRISADAHRQTLAMVWRTASKINRQLLDDNSHVDVDLLWSVTKNDVPDLVRSLDTQRPVQDQGKFSFASAS